MEPRPRPSRSPDRGSAETIHPCTPPPDYCPTDCAASSREPRFSFGRSPPLPSEPTMQDTSPRPPSQIDPASHGAPGPRARISHVAHRSIIVRPAWPRPRATRSSSAGGPRPIPPSVGAGPRFPDVRRIHARHRPRPVRRPRPTTRRPLARSMRRTVPSPFAALRRGEWGRSSPARAIPYPSFVLCRERDVLPAMRSRMLAGLSSRSPLVTTAGAGHLPLVDGPRLTFATLEDLSPTVCTSLPIRPPS